MEPLLLPAASNDLVYDHYKQPLRPVANGVGYMGTLAQNRQGNLIQCHICGIMLPTLGTHINRVHNLNARRYKQMFGLKLTSALVADTVRAHLIESRRETQYTELPLHLQEYNRKVQSGEIKHKVSRHKMSLEQRNLNGTCPDQVLDKIRELGKELGRTPSSDEFRVAYGNRYLYPIQAHFDTWVKAVKKAGYKTTRGEDRTYTKKELLQYLRNFKKQYGRGPTTSDFKRGLMPVARGTYNWHFGTLNHARLEAGMSALIPLSNGKVVEFTAKQFYQYQELKTQGLKKPQRAIAFRQIAAGV